MNVMSVAKPSVTVQISFCISGSTLGRNPTNVTSVGRPSARAQTSLSIRESTRGKSPMNVVNVERLSTETHTLFCIGEFTPEKSPISARSAARPSPGARPHSASQNPHQRASLRVQPRLPRCFPSIPEKLCVKREFVNKPFPLFVSKIISEMCAHGGEKKQPQQVKKKITLMDPYSYISSVLPLPSLWAYNSSTAPAGKY